MGTGGNESRRAKSCAFSVHIALEWRDYVLSGQNKGVPITMILTIEGCTTENTCTTNL